MSALDPDTRPRRRHPALLLLTTLVLGLGACAQAVATEPNPLAGLDERRALGTQLRVQNGTCFQRINDERGWFITNPRKCVAALEQHR